MIEITTTPNEESTIIFTISVTDENGDAVELNVLKSVRWQLSDIDGVVVNNRTFENGSITENPIILTGDDLVVLPSGDCRLLALKIVYDSDLGTDLNATEEAKFEITNLVNI